nr:thioesterase family protein [Marinicella sp. W31]MDC2877249.1 thioesterase family protein [Marinicella sp. W31]
MDLIGADSAYIAKGLSYFTVESHVRYLNEVHEGDTLTMTSQLLSGKGKKMHLFHRLFRSDGELSATVETLLLHTDLNARRTCLPEASVAEKLAEFERIHAELPAEGAGRFVGERPGSR